MTTLLLQTAGTMIGGAVAGPLGAALGSALGSAAGYAIDQQLFASDDIATREGPRLSELQVQTSTEGAPISRLYGRARLNGQIIWATDFVEKVNKRIHKSGGGKGAPKSRVEETTYSYFANFAVGLCEGEIADIGRIWANGKAIDLQNCPYRLYKGSDTQLPDSMIEAKQGAGQAPAYRGLAYVVFEELPLEEFGNRIPQLSFEVIRPVSELESKIKSVVMIPGATEFGYDTELVSRQDGQGHWVTENRHGFEKGSDFEASVNQLLAVCPNLQSVALVVSWFGTDLRASHCAIHPCTDHDQKITKGGNWSVAGLSRAEARRVSYKDGRANYGGTPSDNSVVNAIKHLKARGLKVVLYPFILMDIPDGNGLPNPYGGDQQPAFPWRGRITCHPASGQPNSTDTTPTAKNQVRHLFEGQTWSYKRMVTHYADLVVQAGGVDAFLIGSELRGLTQVRDEEGTYPFVTCLQELAQEAKSKLGPDCNLTYAADWSEYFGHKPEGEDGTFRFNLDPLWADEHIDAIGIDNYMPLSDWWSGESHKDRTLSDHGLDQTYLSANIAGGEGYDWFYASDQDRKNQIRAPITDGTHNKPWMFRVKDLVGWWSNPHFERVNGIEQSQPTVWQPKSKPFWFTELGCAAVDKGCNQPNRFPDAKSSEDGLPHFSAGSRDDAAQRAFLGAHLDYWTQQEDMALNPASPHYEGRMVDPDHLYLWAWDARPFPAFPQSTQVWSDGASWQKGHWLNGRLGNAPIGSILTRLLADYHLPTGISGNVQAVLDGFVIDRPMSARAALEQLCDAFGLMLISDPKGLIFKPLDKRVDHTISECLLVDQADEPQASWTQNSWDSFPKSLNLGFTDLFLDFRQSVARSDHMASTSSDIRNVSLAAVSHLPLMQQTAQTWLRRQVYARGQVSFALSPTRLDIQVGDRITLKEAGRHTDLVIDEIEDGIMRQIQAHTVPPANSSPIIVTSRSRQSTQPTEVRPILEVMDLPTLPGHQDWQQSPYLAAFAKPWPGALQLYLGNAELGLNLRQSLPLPAVMGELISPLRPAKPHLWSYAEDLDIQLFDGDLSSMTTGAVLSGGNVAAIKTSNGQWEVIQFVNAELTGPNKWRLRKLLRGQLGTDHAAQVGAHSGARFVLLDEAIEPLKVSPDELGLTIEGKVISAGGDLQSEHATGFGVELNGRGLKPYAPVHFKCNIDEQNGWKLSWIRRDRLNADSWIGLEIPLSEARESYRLIFRRESSATILREVEVGQSAWTYSHGQRVADGLGTQDVIELEICQLSDRAGAGYPLKVHIEP